MPRKADALLEGRILTAAYRIWSERGEEALTMRAVARAARTTTPTLYERFSHKSDLLTLLRRRARLNLFSAIRTSRSPLDACRRALDFFTAHPNDYRLISGPWPSLTKSTCHPSSSSNGSSLGNLAAPRSAALAWPFPSWRSSTVLPPCFILRTFTKKSPATSAMPASPRVSP